MRRAESERRDAIRRIREANRKLRELRESEKSNRTG